MTEKTESFKYPFLRARYAGRIYKSTDPILSKEFLSYRQCDGVDGKTDQNRHGVADDDEREVALPFPGVFQEHDEAESRIGAKSRRARAEGNAVLEEAFGDYHAGSAVGN